MDHPPARTAMSLRQFCEAYSVSRSFAYLEIKAKRLLVRKAGRRVLVLQKDANAWVDALPSVGELIRPLIEAPKA